MWVAYHKIACDREIKSIIQTELWGFAILKLINRFDTHNIKKSLMKNLLYKLFTYNHIDVQTTNLFHLFMPQECEAKHIKFYLTFTLGTPKYLGSMGRKIWHNFEYFKDLR